MKTIKFYYGLILILLLGIYVAICGPSSGKQGTDDTIAINDTVAIGDTVAAGETVDLGLSVKWAACNLGATKPEGYGSYYAWGESKPKERYTGDNSKWYDVDYDVLKSKGVINSRGNLTPKYDAATANWGAGLRMPTFDEIKELKNRCRWNWTSMNGVKGYKVTGPSGKSIFLPAAGIRHGSESLGVGTGNFCWSSTAYEGSGDAYNLVFSSDDYDWGRYGRYEGCSVRPVSE